MTPTPPPAARTPYLETWVLAKLPASLRPAAQAVLGPVLATIDTFLAPFRGDWAKVKAEPLVYLGVFIAAVHAVGVVHGGTANYIEAYVVVAFRVFTRPLKDT